MSAINRRVGALNAAATRWLGIGAGLKKPEPVREEPKGDDDGGDDSEMKAAEKEQAEKDRKEKARRARNKKAGRAEDDDGDDGDGDESDDDREDREDDEDNKEMKDDKTKGARLNERARCATIMACPAAKGREEAAARLAFTTDMPRHQACALLETLPVATKAATLAERNAAIAGRSAGTGGATAPLTGYAAVLAQAEEIASRVAVSLNSKRA